MSDINQQTSCMQRFFDVLSRITWENMDTKVVQKAKDCVADYISVLCPGQEDDGSKKVLSALGGNIHVLSAENLAFWMGSASRVLDMDDGHRLAFGHPGVPIISGALAALRLPGVKADGKRFLVGLCRAYELYGYLGITVNPSARLGRGFETSSLCGTAAAALVAGVVAGASDTVIFHAVTIAMMHSGGLIHSFDDGSSPKYLCCGWAGKIAIISLQMAQAGLDGPSEALEGRRGFCQAHSDDVNITYRDDPQLRWEIMSVYFKRYACVRRIHATLDVAEELIREHKITSDMVERVDVISNYNMVALNKYDIKHIGVAQASTPFCLALFLEKGEVTSELMTENLHNPTILALMRRIKIVENEDFNHLLKKNPGLWGMAEVVFILKGGKTVSKRMDIAYGDPEKPFPGEFQREKLFRYLNGTPVASKREYLWEMIQKFDELEDVNQQLLIPLFSS